MRHVEDARVLTGWIIGSWAVSREPDVRPAVFAGVEDREVLVGRPAFLHERGIALGPLAGYIEELEDIGRTVIAVDHQPAAPSRQ